MKSLAALNESESSVSDVSHPSRKRSIRNYLLYPKMQLKYAGLYSGLVAALGMIVVTLQVAHNNQLAEQISDPAVLETVQELQRRTLLLQMGAFGIALLVLFLMTVLITHRFVGPIVAIIRHLRANSKNKRLTLRRHDELKPLIDFLNSVDITVNDREP